MLTKEKLEQAVPFALSKTTLPQLGEREEGKVRDIYRVGERRVLITTDRVSAFDRVLGVIPYKGQVLNQLSLWWYKHLEDLVSHHLIASPDPNVMVVHEAKPLPVEVIVRGYITGSTSTSLWTLYNEGVERPYGLELPEGLKKNDKLPVPVITPTTKAARGEHDERLTNDQVVSLGLVEPGLWREVQETAIAIFKRGQEVASRAGLILVDTKYEFGMIDGKLALIDEVHTPDSSRYWVADSYREAQAKGEKPEHFDKEFLRLWFGAQGYRGEGTAPEIPAEFAAQVSARYISAYERLTGEQFVPGPQPVAGRIADVNWGAHLAL